jgi:hypothetical protein
MAPCRSAFETLVRLAVVEQIADAVHHVFENRSGGKDDDTDLWINKWNDVESRNKSGDLSSEAEIFECVHDYRGNLSICKTELGISAVAFAYQLANFPASLSREDP